MTTGERMPPCHQHLSVKYFLLPQKVPVGHFLSPPRGEHRSALFPPQANFTCSRSSQKWNQMGYCLLRLVSFAPHYAFEIYSCVCLDQYLLPVGDWAVVHRMNAPRFVYSLVNEHSGCVQYLDGTTKAAVNSRPLVVANAEQTPKDECGADENNQGDTRKSSALDKAVKAIHL